jgi:hypothetical protein
MLEIVLAQKHCKGFTCCDQLLRCKLGGSCCRHIRLQGTGTAAGHSCNRIPQPCAPPESGLDLHGTKSTAETRWHSIMIQVMFAPPQCMQYWLHVCCALQNMSSSKKLPI